MGTVRLGWWIVLVAIFVGVSPAKIHRFGAISTVKPEIVKKRFRPLLDYLEERTGERFIFETGRDYDDTIEKFIDGTFDLGYIGPSPYVIAQRRAPGSLRILAGVESDFTPFFRAVIVSRKDAPFDSLTDLEGQRFAFGSYRSTLSFYLPYYMLYKAGVIDRLAGYEFLGRHDIVVKNVIMGAYAAGGVKGSVAKRYGKYLKTLAFSEPVTDFAIVANRKMDPKLAEKIRKALLELRDTRILQSIKPDMTGFGPRRDSDYNRLREIMRIVDEKVGIRGRKSIPKRSD